MEAFVTARQEDGTWRFERNGINIIVDGFDIESGTHNIKNPETAVAFFNIKGYLYGLSNHLQAYTTVEHFYKVMEAQYQVFKGNMHQNIHLLPNNSTPNANRGVR